MPTDLWGGLLVTLVVASVGIVASFPLGMLLALGRRSDLPIVRWVSIGYIEFVRGVPLITMLFMASVMLPLFLPPGVSIDKLLRALVGVALFSAAYLAEVVRGGLQAIPRGQFEAADALGLSYSHKMGLIVLPQALKLVIPGIVNSFISCSRTRASSSSSACSICWASCSRRRKPTRNGSRRKPGPPATSSPASSFGYSASV